MQVLWVMVGPQSSCSATAVFGEKLTYMAVFAHCGRLQLSLQAAGKDSRLHQAH